jgi:hypothetical protein
VTRLRAGRPGFDSRQKLGTFLFATASREDLQPTQPPIQWILVAIFLRVKRPGREADLSPSNIVEVKNAWSFNSTPSYCMAWFLVKNRDKFTFFYFTDL